MNFAFRQRLTDLLYILLPISYVIGSGISYGKFRFFHLILVLAIVFHLKTLRNYFKTFQLNRESFYFISFGLFYLLSFLWAQNPNDALKYIIILFLNFSFIFLTKIQTESFEKFQKLLNSLNITYFILLIIGTAESFEFFRWPLSPYSILSASETPLKTFEFLKNVPSSCFSHMNDFAFYIASFFPIFLYSTKNKKVLVLGIAMASWVLLMISSRAAFIAFIPGLVFGTFFILQGIQKKIIGFLSIFVFLALLTFPEKIPYFGPLRTEKISSLSVVFTNYPLKFFKKHEVINFDNKTTQDSIATELPEDQIDLSKKYVGSLDERSKIIQAGKLKFIQNKFIGVGAGNASVSIEENGPKLSIHNFWLEILIDCGMIGFGLLLLYLIFKLKQFYINFHSKNLIFAACFISLICLLPGAMGPSSSIYQPGFWIPILIFSILSQKKNIVTL